MDQNNSIRSFGHRLISRREGESRLLALVAVIAIGVWIFAFLTNSLGGKIYVDDLIVNWIFPSYGEPFNSKGLYEVARDITSLGSGVILTFLTITNFAYIIARGDRRGAWFLFAVLVGALILTFGLKFGIDRTRPDFATGIIYSTTSPSFPSGHSLLTAAIFPALATIFARRESILGIRLMFLSFALLVAVAVGISRVLVGAHYPSDVIAGWSLGFAWVATCRIGFSYYERKVLRGGDYNSI
ncbi:MAG: phosphatase PAP2 family protein [Ignavibacteriae bacterium]|nr:phosphatase PAP2 family protein [Ignavibacteriota bacterium]MCB9215648.1 phosphatase PAP2 family protein [Ignavibacteria bacterium]